MSSIFMSELGGRVSILLVNIPCITRMMVISAATASLNVKKTVANVVAISIAEPTFAKRSEEKPECSGEPTFPATRRSSEQQSEDAAMGEADAASSQDAEATQSLDEIVTKLDAYETEEASSIRRGLG